MSYRFREAREKAGLSAAEVGRRIGVSQPAVTQWETGAKVPSVEMLCKLAEAMNLRAMAPAYAMGYSPAAKPISHEDLSKHQELWIKPISPDSFLQDELTGWYHVNEFYVQNEYGTRFMFDTYGTKWLAFEMEF